MARHVWESRQRPLPRGIAPGPRGHWSLPCGVPVPERARFAAARWPIWYGAVLSDLAGFAFVTRGKEYTVLDHPLVQARLHLPPDQSQQREDKPGRPQPLRLSRRAGGV